MNIIGIDPGKDGAVAKLLSFHGDHELLQTELTPMVKVSKGKKVRMEYDLVAMRRVLAIAMFEGADHVFLEKAQAMTKPGKQKQGVTSMFSFGRGFGLWEGILVGMEIPYTIVHPRTWQKPVHRDITGDDPKGRSLIAAGRLFPGHDFRRSERARIPHSGMVDAALIAWYGRWKMGSQADGWLTPGERIMRVPKKAS
jgi:crossover junction endodeoxyribonuclease RuvC